MNIIIRKIFINIESTCHNMKAKLITYTFANLPIAARNQLRTRLLGHNDSSHGGKYKYRRHGLLDTITHIKPSRGTIIAPLKEATLIIQMITECKAEYKTYDIQIAKSQFNK